jgi:hypothetical protein
LNSASTSMAACDAGKIAARQTSMINATRSVSGQPW